MLEIRKGDFSKSYENIFFREISRSLAENFNSKGISWLLIGSPDCNVDEAFKPDAILVTEKVLLLIEFKDYGGSIQLPDVEGFALKPWRTEDWESVSSGNAINPYLQVRKQEKRFSKILRDCVIPKLWDGEKINPNRTVCMVCFQKDVILSWKVPDELELSFFIKPSSEIISGILDVIEIQKAGTSIKTESFRHFENLFRSAKFDPNSEKHDAWIDETIRILNENELQEDQITALDNIRRFIASDKETAFILKGASGSGKTHLIPFIQEMAIKWGCTEVVILGLNRSVCRNLIARPWIEDLDSIYSHIYGGFQKSDKSESESDEKESISTKDGSEVEIIEKVKIVPIRKNEDSEKTLYVIDEAHHVNESTGSPQGVIFWTGKLLSDFLEYSKGKKVIFIGDPYLLQHGKSTESCLSEKHLLDAHGITAASFELTDKDWDKTLLKNALKCVRCLRSNQFNDLNFELDEDFAPLEKQEFLQIANRWCEKDRVVLKYTNEEASRVNAYFKAVVCKTGDSVSEGDLVFFDENTRVRIVEWPIEIADEKWKVYKWEYATILEISNDERRFTLNEQEYVIASMTASLRGSMRNIRVDFLKNYLESEEIRSDAELWKKLQILKANELRKTLKDRPFRKSAEYHNLRENWNNDEEMRILDEYAGIFDVEWAKKAGQFLKKRLRKDLGKHVVSVRKKYESRIRHEQEKDENSTYSKIENAARLRYGWAMTVHKAQMRKWSEIVLDGDVWSMGKDTEPYCRWLYTGLTRSSGTLKLANFKPNHPLMLANCVNASTGKKSALPFFSSQKSDAQERIREFVAHIEKKLALTSYKVRHLPRKAEQYRVFLEFEDSEGHSFEMAAYFTANGDFRRPDFVSKDVADSERTCMEHLAKSEWNVLAELPNGWRKRTYESIARILEPESFALTHLLQHPYKDYLAFERYGNQSIVEFNYGWSGFYSNIKLTNCEDPNDWALIENAITSLRP